MTEVDHVPVLARDGFALRASVFRPKEDRRGEAVIIASAMAVKRAFYEPFARHLAGRGFDVVTFDYRGIGDSGPRSLRGFEATLADWGRLDLAGVIDWAEATLSPRRLIHVGHSCGGQLVGLADKCDRYAKVLLVAAQSGYWRLWDGAGKARMFAIWNALIPLSTKTLGYFPGRRIGWASDVPAGVALEWARWGRHPEYLLGYESPEGFAAMRADVLSISFSDDHFGPVRAADRAATWFVNCHVERRHLTPAELGVKSVGHFGFFRQGVTPGLWEETARWMEGDQAETAARSSPTASAPESTSAEKV